jgi:hypothetical protein
MQAMGGQESEDLKIIINLLGMHLSQLVCCLNQEEGLKYINNATSKFCVKKCLWIVPDTHQFRTHFC